MHAPFLWEAQELMRRCSAVALIAFHAAIAIILNGSLNMLRQTDSDRGWDLVAYLPYHAWPPAGYFRP